jgi:hypothetical protein
MIANLSTCQHWLDRGAVVANNLARYAALRQATSADCKKLSAMAARVFPILAWKIDRGEIDAAPPSVAMMSLLIPFGISTSALQRTDIPMELRQALLPLLRPDSFQEVLQWWDDYAVSTWVEPYLLSLAKEEFGALFGVDATDGGSAFDTAASC